MHILNVIIDISLKCNINRSGYFRVDQNWPRKEFEKVHFGDFLHSSQLNRSIKVIIFSVLGYLFHWKINICRGHKIKHVCKIPTWTTLFSICYGHLIKKINFYPQTKPWLSISIWFDAKKINFFSLYFKIKTKSLTSLRFNHKP
jgi:hypothetical protein